MPRRIALTSVLLVCTVLLGACGSSGSSDAKREKSAGTLRWTPCGAPAECASLQVPLDSTKPDGEQISIALLRIRATGPGKAHPALLINPGGPGVSGNEALRSLGRSIVSPEVAAAYDLVSWDPRGTGESLPVQCGDRLDYLFDDVTYAPRTDAQRAALTRVNQRFVDACTKGMGAKLAFIGTRDTVLDMERMRVALGQEKLHYLGFSYGTYLGAEYIAQFQDRTGRIVLDGAVNPALPTLTTLTEQSVGFDKALDAFFASCTTTTTCAFAGDQAPKVAYQQLAARVTVNPLPVSFGKTLGPTQLDIGTAEYLYSGTAAWSALARALTNAQRGDGEALYDAFSKYVGRATNGVYSTQYPAFIAIGCVDAPSFGSVDATFAAARTVGTAAPIFGEASVNYSLSCATWPVAPTSGPGAVSAPNASPLLILGTTGDPATPVSWAVGLSKQLQTSRLITMPGEQHTAYQQGNSCVDGAVNTYLLRGETPTATLACQAA